MREGAKQSVCNSFLIDLRYNSSFNTSIPIQIPANFVSDSSQIIISVAGDILEKTIHNLDNLIPLPLGNGEQNLLKIAPIVSIVDYLNETNQLTPEIKSEAFSLMEESYQNELTYLRQYFGFTTYGTQNLAAASTWLTAFAVQYFNKAKNYIFIDEYNVLSNYAIWYLTQRQLSDGSVEELGYIFNQASKTGSVDQTLALTIYTTITFLESSDYRAEDFQKKSMPYIDEKLKSTNDIYSICLAAYAYQLANYTNKDLILQKCTSKSQMTNDGYVFWNMQQNASNSNDENFSIAFNIEVTSYALRALIKAGRLNDAFPIAKWIISKQNENGGFYSTQDTVVAITALTELEISLSNNNVDLKQKIVAKYSKFKTTFTVESSYAHVLQQKYVRLSIN